jgi:hypothetical protein
MKSPLRKELKSKSKNELIHLLEQCLEQIKRSIIEIDRLKGVTEDKALESQEGSSKSN